jgi:hypothetical protein
MNSLLDSAIVSAASAEATYNADQSNVETIQTAIAAATSPLSAAVKQASSDAVAFNASLDSLSSAALAAKITLS